jgi:hypothetical protein
LILKNFPVLRINLRTSVIKFNLRRSRDQTDQPAKMLPIGNAT